MAEGVSVELPTADVRWRFCGPEVSAFLGAANNHEYAGVRHKPCQRLGTPLGTYRVLPTQSVLMPTKLNKLSARRVATVSKPGRHSDGGGLYLLVKSTGAKSWVFMFKRAGRQREMGLGSLLGVSLATARERAAEARTTLAEGGDPLQLRHKLGAMNFGELADAHIEAMSPSWRSAKHASQWTMTLKAYAAPLRGKTAAAITTDDVLGVLRPIWASKPETASRLRGRIESILDAAKAKGLRTGDNPARWEGHLDQLLPKRMALSRGHQRALPYADVAPFLKRLRSNESVSSFALQFAILTAARTSEVTGAVWSEVDLSDATWTIPKERMKAEREHRVPLSRSALAILRKAAEAKSGPFVFPGQKAGHPLSNMAMLQLLRGMQIDATTHGFRSSFRDWAAEVSDFPGELAEMALAHSVGDAVEQAYRRGDMFMKRRAIMDSWAAYCGV